MPQGGRYDYLYRIGWGTHVVPHKDAISRVADRLAGAVGETPSLPAADDAAEATRTILHRIEELEQMIEPLRGVWKAVEWHDSGDWPVEEVTKALTEWRQHLIPDAEIDRLRKSLQSAEARALYFMREKERIAKECVQLREELRSKDGR
jgi:hypothetical protein